MPSVLPEENSRRAIFLTVAAASILIALIYSSLLSWVCDDAFISFRYAQNFLRGLGLVYNAGERVEGYTNFLWTMMIAAGMKAGIEPARFTVVAGIVIFLCTVALLALASWKMQSKILSNRILFPIAAAALSLHHEMNAYATGGLETALFAFLVTSLYVVLVFGETEKAIFAAGVVAAVLLLARPDGNIFVLASLIYLACTRKNRIKSIWIFLAPAAVLYAPYWLWRYSYYGYVFPNTYYAKSIGLANYGAGLFYVKIFFQSYYVFTVLPLLIALAGWKYRAVLWQWLGKRGEPNFFSGEHPALKPVLLGSLFILFQTAFVIRIGGDFMFGRFFIPIIPIMFFVIETLIVVTLPERAALIVGALVLVTTVLRVDQFKGGSQNGYVEDEQKYYSRYPFEAEQSVGERLHNALEGLSVRVAFKGSDARLIYYMDPTLAIEAETGLTDVEIAHQEIATRGRPGHEKAASEEYLLRRKVQIFFDNDPGRDTNSLQSIVFFDMPARIFIYDNTLMSRLASTPGIQFTHLPEVLDDYLSRLNTFKKNDVARDYARLKPFYFDYNVDSLRENRFKAFLRDSSLH